MKNIKTLFKAYMNPSRDRLYILYYNPDSDSNGQYVMMMIDKSLIEYADLNSKADAEFENILESYAKTNLIDKSDNDADNQEFKYIDLLFKSNELSIIPDLNKQTIVNIFDNKNIKIL